MAVTKDDALAENEFALIQEISKSPSSTQRELSTSTGLSLGMTNLLIKRLARKGYIKISQLDWKRTQYLLTLKGAFEKAKKSYNYSLYTIRIFRQIRDNIRTVLKREHDAGQRAFTIVAQDEVLELVREAVSDLAFPDATYTFVDDFKDAAGELVLTATLEAPPEPKAGQRFIVLVDFRNLDFKPA